MRQLCKLFLCCFFLLNSVTAFGQQNKIYDHSIDKYSGWEGLNDRTLDIAIKPTQLSYVRNVNYDNYPFLTKREGYDKHTNYQIASDRIRGLFPFYKVNGTKYIICVTNQKVYDVTYGCWTELKSGLTNLDIEYDAAAFEDNLLIVSNSDPMMEFDGTTVTDLGGNPPQCSFIEAFAYRVWLAGNCTQPSRLYFSALLDETAWDTGTEYDDVSTAGLAGYIDIEPNDGDKITGIGVNLDSIIIFKERGIWVLKNAFGSPLTDWSLKKVSADVGAVSNKSIAQVKNELVFLSRKGIQSFGGVLTGGTYEFDELRASSLSDNIKGTVNTLNQAQWQKSCAVNFDDKYWLSVPGSGSGYNDLVLILDYVVGAWTVYDGIHANYFCVFKESSEDELFFGDSRDYAFVYKYGDVDYDGALQAPATTAGTQCTHSLQDTSKSWAIDEFKGCRVNLFCGSGEGQTRTIVSNSSDTLVVTPGWAVVPVSGTTLYAIGSIEMDIRTGFLSMRVEGQRTEELDKQFIEAYIQTKSFGTDTYYLKVFFDIDQTGWSPMYTIDLKNNYDDYGTDLWGESSYAGKNLITKRAVFPTEAIGKYIKVRYYNYRPDERITVYNTVFSFDVMSLQNTGIE